MHTGLDYICPFSPHLECNQFQLCTQCDLSLISTFSMSVRKSHPHTGATPLKEGFACLMYGCWGARWQSLSQQQCGKTSLHHHSTRAVLAKRCHFCPVDSAKRTGIPYAVMLISMGIIKRTGSLICPRKMASLTPKISK